MRAREILLESGSDKMYTWNSLKNTLEAMGVKTKKVFQLMQALPEHVEEYSWNTILRALGAIGLSYPTTIKVMGALRNAGMSQIEEQPQVVSELDMNISPTEDDRKINMLRRMFQSGRLSIEELSSMISRQIANPDNFGGLNRIAYSITNDIPLDVTVENS